MSNQVFDFCFVGLGAAAAVHLLTHKEFFRNKRVLVLEASSSFAKDKTLCSFSNLRFDSFNTKLWSCFDTVSGGRQQIFETRTPYQFLDIRLLFETLKTFLQECPTIEVKYQTPVSSIERGVGHFLINRAFQAQHLFDSRPVPLKKPYLVQHFYGLEIEFENSCPIHQPIIMEIDESYHQGLKFFYIIPKSQSRLLVEITYFSDQTYSLLDYRSEIERFLKSKAWPIYREVGEEYGEIPLVRIVPPRNLPPQYHPLGIRAGNLRASTGYSVWRSYRQSLVQGPWLKYRYDLKWKLVGWMDHVFLKTLEANPNLNAAIFSTFFKKLKGDSISSFMSENPSWLSLIMVIFIMPKRPFIRALFQRSKFSHVQHWSSPF